MTDLPAGRSAHSAGARGSVTDAFPAVLAVLLVGYAFIGKGFAYLGVPPFYVGEIVLIFGLAALFRSGCILAATASLGSLLLLALLAWIGVRVVVDFPRYGFDALRDGVVALYGLYAFVVVAVLISKPTLIDRMIHHYRRFVIAFVAVPPIAMVFSSSIAAQIPTWPGSDLPLISLRAGEIAIHLAGAAAFVLAGFYQPGWLWSVMLTVGVGIVFTLNRGGMLAFLVPALFAAALTRNRRQVLGFAAIALLIGGTAAAVDVNIRIEGGRHIDFDQLADNVISLFGETDSGNLGGTKEWRLAWWKAIVGYTIHGDYFWFGKGFGPNLSETDGFKVGTGAPPLRSPHNVHMTFLARSGVCGLALWLTLLVVWFAIILRTMAAAKRDGEAKWRGFFIFIGAYVLAVVVDASFDVAIEGPMVGIWFWTLIGVGIGAAMIYWSKYPSRSALRYLPAIAAILLASLAVSQPTTASADESQKKTSPPSLTSTDGPCLVIKHRADETIENLHIGPCRGHGIEIFGSDRITIRNVTIEGTGGSGILVLKSEDVTVENNVINDTISSVSVQDSQRIVVKCNRLSNPRGPIPRGQFVQFGDVYGPGNLISCNTGVNAPGRGTPEDAISLYRSSGTPESPIVVERNTIIGGGPSPSGGGIMLGDGGGSHLAARDNILEDPGQYGIGVAGEHDIEVTGNVVVARRQPFTNVGISVWRQDPPACHNIAIRNNVVHWIAAGGWQNPWWNGPGYCRQVDGVPSNNFSATPAQISRRKSEIRCNC